MVYTQQERNKAMQRALKWTRLFNPNHFDEILDAIVGPNRDGTYNANDLDTALGNIAGITTEEKAWLKNYLMHCSTLWDTDNVLEAAAGTGW